MTESAATLVIPDVQLLESAYTGPISPELVLVDPALAVFTRALLSREPHSDCLAAPATDLRRPTAEDPVLPQESVPRGRSFGVLRGVLLGAGVIAVVAGVLSVPGGLLPFRGADGPGVTLPHLTPPVQPAERRYAPAPTQSIPRSAHGEVAVRAQIAPPSGSATRKHIRPKSSEGPKRQRQPAPARTTPASTSHSTPPPGTRRKPRAPTKPKQHPIVPPPPPTADVAPLAWAPVASAIGYHLELVKGDRRVFAATTTRSRLHLPSEWSYRGRRYRLLAGSYRWYVWPMYRQADEQTATLGRPIVAAKLTIPG